MINLDHLNDKQKKAVLSNSKQLLIIAGAGTGKTKTVTEKIKYLIYEKGVDPYEILAITFTNKAANEMKERILSSGINIRDMLICTFHSLCLRILRQTIHHLGYTKDFLIYDTDDKNKLIKSLLKELNINTTRELSVSIVSNHISNAKINDQVPEDLINSSFEHISKIGYIYDKYQKALKNANALDFDDLIMFCVRIFDQYEDVRSFYSNRFKYIFVDEYQDTNMQQFKLIEQLTRNNKNICVVGDEDQSIYKFRGADIRNIQNFESIYPNAEVIKLEQNYRSTSKILDKANKLIKNNYGRKDKNLWTDKIDGEEVVVAQCNSESHEAEIICEKINLLKLQDKFNYSDITILYRGNRQSRAFEEALFRFGIPFKIVNGLNFYQRKEIKDVLAYLRIVVNKDDDVALNRIINTPKRGIGETSMQKMKDAAILNNMSLYDCMRNIEEFNILSKSLTKNVKEFIELIESFKNYRYDSLEELIKKIVDDIKYIESYDVEEAEERRENIEELYNKATYMQEKNEAKIELVDFLQELTLYTEMDDSDFGDNYVKLMTVHSAKGLEFPCVFVTGLESGVFPSYRSLEEEGGIEEERRLCYVAVTRAKELLNLTWAKSRNKMYQRRSEFIDEMMGTDYLYSNKKEYYNKGIVNHSKKILTNKEILSNRSNCEENFSVGDRVKHRKFGIGTVKDIFNKDGYLNVTVDFDTNGTKQLTVIYAKLEKI